MEGDVNKCIYNTCMCSLHHIMPCHPQLLFVYAWKSIEYVCKYHPCRKLAYASLCCTAVAQRRRYTWKVDGGSTLSQETWSLSGFNTICAWKLVIGFCLANACVINDIFVKIIHRPNKLLASRWNVQVGRWRKTRVRKPIKGGTKASLWSWFSNTRSSRDCVFPTFLRHMSKTAVLAWRLAFVVNHHKSPTNWCWRLCQCFAPVGDHFFERQLQ